MEDWFLFFLFFLIKPLNLKVHNPKITYQEAIIITHSYFINFSRVNHNYTLITTDLHFSVGY